MSKQNEPECRAIKETSKWLYFIIVGLSVAIAIETIKEQEINMINFLLFFSLIVTLIRFSFGFTGAIFDKNENHFGPYKTLIINLHFYIANAILFIAIAINISDIDRFILWFSIMLFVDIIWILSTLFPNIKEILNNKTKIQFLLSNIILFTIFSFCYFFLNWIYDLYNYINESELLSIKALLIFISCMVAAVWDYISNEEYYKKLVNINEIKNNVKNKSKADKTK